MATRQGRVELKGSTKKALAGAKDVGPADANELIEVSVLLRRGSKKGTFPAVEKMGAQLPRKRTYLSREDFARLHGAKATDLKKIEAFAAAHGLRVVSEEAARRTVKLSGTVKAFSEAFGVELRRFEHETGTYRGREGSLTIPKDLQGIVEGVFGLDNRPQSKPHFRIHKDKAAAVAVTPLQVAQAYSFPAGTTGSGQCIGIIELGGGYNALRAWSSRSARRSKAVVRASPRDSAARAVRSPPETKLLDTSSAAALGVSARTSAAKSHSVKSISCPTAEIIGIRHAATATNGSSLNAHKSSRLPPPRPMTRRSNTPTASASRSISIMSAAAPSPWTFAGRTTSRPRQPRRSRIFGLYGLKSWGDSVKSRIVADAAIVERVIQRAAPPLTFARLCSILEVPPVGELSERLWQNCAKLSEIVRIPEERSDTSLLIHESCGLERALVATAREIKSPMALYEFQWALNDRFGALFATKSLDELRRSLEQSPMFLRNAADEFILDINVDQLGLDGAAIRQACAEILSESNEIVGCEDLLERLEAVGKSWEELSPDILASLLREGTTFQEVGYDRFRVRTCKR